MKKLLVLLSVSISSLLISCDENEDQVYESLDIHQIESPDLTQGANTSDDEPREPNP